MKKLINAPADVVNDMLRGLVALHPGLSLLSEERVVFRSDAATARDRQVALISGGGSGHEPAHAGYVGEGMLSAAVAGEVFTSPTPNSVRAAIKQVTGEPGVLLIVKNYTGDRLNFGLAAEMARAEGLSVETVIVGDDVALASSTAYAGARGLAGTILVHKIAGATAAMGRSLRDVALVARSAASDIATLGLSLSAGIVPAVGKPSYMLAEGEIELGLGIHGEPGVRRMPLRQADELADEMVETLASAAKLQSGDRIALMVNNLGSTTAMELAIFGGKAVRSLQSRGLLIERAYSGAFMTSLEAAGVSLSVLPVDDDRLALLDAPTAAPAWPNAVQKSVGSVDERIVGVRVAASHEAARTITGKRTNSRLLRAVDAACDALIEAEPRLTELDRITGDGDLGINLARGARAVKAALPCLPLDDAAALQSMASEFQQSVGGTSGPLYAVMLVRASQSIQQGDWAKAAMDACKAVEELGGAKPGDRTMLDALVPFATRLRDAHTLEEAVRAAEEGAQATASMWPRRGRASYLGDRALGHPDAGAVAIAIWLRAIDKALKS